MKIDWDRIKEWLFNSIGLGSVITFLYIFAKFWATGHVTLVEDNIAIRTVETIMIVGGILVGIERFLSDLKDEAVDKIKRLQSG